MTTKRKEVDHIPWVWGSVPRALRARGSPAIILETLLPNLILIAISFYIVLFIFFSLYMVNYICPNTIREVFTPPLHVRGLKVDTNLTHEKALTLLTRRKRLEGAIKKP